MTKDIQGVIDSVVQVVGLVSTYAGWDYLNQ